MMYRPDKLKCRAVVSGLQANMDTLNRLKVGKKFMPGNFDIVMSEVTLKLYISITALLTTVFSRK